MASSVQLAQVDCSMNPVEAYAMLMMSRDTVYLTEAFVIGAFVEKYKGVRDFDLLVMYLTWNAPTASSSSMLSRPLLQDLLKPLNPGNFNRTIAQGLWFVQFFSPRSGIVFQFAPTWKRLVIQSTLSAGAQLAQVDCNASYLLCVANKIQPSNIPSLSLYWDGKFVENYYGRLDFEIIAEYLANAALSPPSVPTPKPNPDGDLVTLSAHNFAAALAEGPAFIVFYPPSCHDRRGCLLPFWPMLAVVLRERVIVSDVHCGGNNHALCEAQGVTMGATLTPTLLYYPSAGAAGVQYLGPLNGYGSLTLDRLTAFVEVSGVFPPPAMEFTLGTSKTVWAQPIIVMASGMDWTIAERVREIASERNALHYDPKHTQMVQFAWEDLRRDDGVVRVRPLAEVGVTVNAARPGYKEVYLTDASGEPIKLTAASIFSVLQGLAEILPVTPEILPITPTAEIFPVALAAATEVKTKSTESVAQQTMQYLYSADAYALTHPLKMLCMFVMALGVMYFGLKRCLRVESETLREEKGLD
ncbi:hypothetical protein K438DRAFT_1964430 [Mycena galopus ATCC 62051]|nr:hypothetical protein K438DRAFT_1964430 [Mycena galopus ATCC 62051]